MLVRVRLRNDRVRPHVRSRRPSRHLDTPNGTYEGVPIAKFGEHQALTRFFAALAASRSGDSVQRPAGRRLGGRGVELGPRFPEHRTDPHLTDHHSGWRTQRECRRSPLRKAIEESYDFKQLVGVVAMMRDQAGRGNIWAFWSRS